jgi:hypothetical protein
MEKIRRKILKKSIYLSQIDKTIQQLIHAIQSKNIDRIKILLSGDGEFSIQDKELYSATRKKRGFLNWFIPILLETPIKKIEVDQCQDGMGKSIVLIINQGKFPRSIKDASERSKTGLLIESKDGKICTIKFCYDFLKMENKYMYECN